MVDFSGQVVLQADEKNRYRIPAKYRSKFGEGPLHFAQRLYGDHVEIVQARHLVRKTGNEKNPSGHGKH